MPLAAAPTDFVAADLNRDGHVDLAVVSSGGSTATILLGNGQGDFTLAPGSPFSAGTNPFRLSVGDFNEDGISDLAVVPRSVTSANPVTFWRGDGSGRFVPAGTSLLYAPAITAYGAGAADFDGDGHLDLLVTDADSATTLLGDGAFGFRSQKATTSFIGAHVGPAIADFDKDGKIDFVTVSDGGTGFIRWMFNTGTGLFSNTRSRQLIVSGNASAVGAPPLGLAVADLNQDGWPDLVIPAFRLPFHAIAIFSEQRAARGLGSSPLGHLRRARFRSRISTEMAS